MAIHSYSQPFNQTTHLMEASRRIFAASVLSSMVFASSCITRSKSAHKNGQLEEERVTPTEARSQVKLLDSTKNKTPGVCFATMATSMHSYAVRVTIFSMVQ